ncbi:MAG: Ig-like domain-containing protein, partial [Chloroflexi bacterium]|nr:Ig-like domain-containing protein [Chloroflexota bacterium]
GIATISSGGLATGSLAGTTTIQAAFAGKSGTAQLTVTAAVLDAIAVTPANPSVAKGRTIQFAAIGTYSNNSVADITAQVTWSSSNAAVVSITGGGLAKGETVGTASVTATLSSKSGSTSVSVTAAELDSITVTPSSPTVAAGRTRQFTATGTFSDSSTANITASVIWVSSNTAVAAMDGTGLATSYAPGAATITATKSGRTGAATLTVTAAVIDSISVSPANRTISNGLTQQFRAFAVYSNGSKVDVTASAMWASTNSGVASINAAGLATGKAAGTTTISATFDSTTGSTTLTVTDATLSSIAISPSTPDIPTGRTQQFTAEGTFTDSSKVDLTNSVSWSSSDTRVARVNSLGLAASYAPGTVNITASWGSVTSPSSRLRVQAAELDGITISPVNPSVTLVAGNPPRIQFRATRVDSDGSTSDATSAVTWASSNTGIATIVSGGLATTVAAGSANITATLSGNTYLTTLTVLADTVPPRVTLTRPVEGMVLGVKTLDVSGSVDDLAANAVVIVNGSASALTLGNDGNFSKGVLLNSGSNTVSVRAVDGSGNTGTSGTVTVVVDPKKPGITLVSPLDGAVTNSAALTVSGNVTNATVVTLTLNGVSQNIAVAAGGFSANVTLLNGVNIIVVQAYAAANPGDPDYLGTSGVRRVTLDTTPPSVAINTPVSGSIVNKALATISGKVNDPAVTTAQLILNGVPRSIPVVSGSFSQDVTLSPGANSIQVVATDTAGNASTTASVGVTLDTTKPELSITAPANNLLTKSASQLVSGTVFDPSIATADLRINGTSQTISIAPDGSFSKMVTLGNGANTIEVRATDAGSNTGTSGMFNVTIDTVSPNIVIGLTDPTDSIIITVSTDEGLSGAPAVSVDGSGVVMAPADVNKWTGVYGSSASPITAGDYTVTVEATDRAGNSAIKTASFTKKKVSVDGVNPTTVTGAGAKLDVETRGAISDADISITKSLSNPSGNVGNPEGASQSAGVFLEIVVSPELRDNLKQMYIEVPYDPNDLPSGTDESTLRLHLWDSASGKWEAVPNSGVNVTEHLIFGTIEHLSKYGGFGTVAPAPPPPAAGVPAAPPGTVSIVNIINFTGTFMMPFTMASADNLLSMHFPIGTKVLDKNGNPSVTWIGIAEQTQPAAMPSDTKAASKFYSLGPDGATFAPPIPVTVSYDPTRVPAGVDEKDLFIGTWSGTTSVWEKLPSTVNTSAHTVTALVSHFSDFAVLASARPAAFIVSGLVVAPTEVDIGQDVTVSVMVANSGDISGTYTVILLVNGEALETRQVTLAGGASQKVSFTVRKDAAGTFKVLIDKLSGTFTVKAPPSAPRPAAFTIRDISISPNEVDLNQNVTISAVAANSGEVSGTYKVTLKVNGVSVATKDITLAGGTSETVTFTVSKDTAGTYTVDVNGLSGTFTVKAAPPEEEVKPPPVPTPQPETNWALIGAVIAVGVVIIILLVVLLVRRRSRGV